VLVLYQYGDIPGKHETETGFFKQEISSKFMVMNQEGGNSDNSQIFNRLSLTILHIKE